MVLLIPFGCSTVGGDIRGLEAENAEDRQEAAQGLGERLEQGTNESDRARIIEALHRAIADKSPVVRMQAVASLGASGNAASVGKILPLLDDESDWVRHAAIQALGALGAADQGPVLGRVLREDPKAPCRIEAAKTIGRLKAEAASDACIDALSDREGDPSVRFAAHEALKAISGLDLPGRPEPWRKWRADRTAPPTSPTGPAAPPAGEGSVP